MMNEFWLRFSGKMDCQLTKLLKLIASTKTILAFVISFILGATLISAYESVYIDFNTDFGQEEMSVIKNNISYNNIDRNIPR